MIDPEITAFIADGRALEARSAATQRRFEAVKAQSVTLRGRGTVNAHPRREDYASEPEWVIACAEALDAIYPARMQHRERLAAWRLMEAVGDPEATVTRMRELIDIDRPFTTDEAAEWEALATAWHEIKRAKAATS